MPPSPLPQGIKLLCADLHPAAASIPIARQQLTALDSAPAILSTQVACAAVLPYTLDGGIFQQAAIILLQKYPILAGRYSRAPSSLFTKAQPLGHAVLCNNAGAAFLETTMQLSLNNLREYLFARSGFSFDPSRSSVPPYCMALDPDAWLSGKGPLLGLQLSHLALQKGGASVVSITIAHMLADGHSIIALLNALAATYRGLLLLAALPLQPISITSTGTGVEVAVVVAQPKGPPAVRQAGKSAALVFDKDLISKHQAGDVRSPCPPGSAAEVALDSALIPVRPAKRPGPFKAFISQVRAVAAIGKELQSMGSNISAMHNMTTLVLHVPAADILALKTSILQHWAAFPDRTSVHTSSNDVLSALLWLLMCSIRGRSPPPLPTAATGAAAGVRAPATKQFFGMAMDLRQNCPRAPLLPADFFGNAATTITARASGPVSTHAAMHKPVTECRPTEHAPSHSSKQVGHGSHLYHVGSSFTSPNTTAAATAAGNAAVPAVEPGAVAMGSSIVPGPAAEEAAQGTNGMQGSSSRPVLRSAPSADASVAFAQLAQAAWQVRSTLETVRSSPDVGRYALQLAQQYVSSGKSNIATMWGHYIRRFDSFLTSWGNFPVWVDFGRGPACFFQPLLQPTAPWSGLSTPAPPPATAAHHAAAASLKAAEEQPPSVHVAHHTNSGVEIAVDSRASSSDNSTHTALATEVEGVTLTAGGATAAAAGFGRGACEGGQYLHITLPLGCAGSLREHPLLHTLVPNAAFLA